MRTLTILQKCRMQVHSLPVAQVPTGAIGQAYLGT